MGLQLRKAAAAAYAFLGWALCDLDTNTSPPQPTNLAQTHSPWCTGQCSASVLACRWNAITCENDHGSAGQAKPTTSEPIGLAGKYGESKDVRNMKTGRDCSLCVLQSLSIVTHELHTIDTLGCLWLHSSFASFTDGGNRVCNYSREQPARLEQSW
jgi:hypothetical protein